MASLRSSDFVLHCPGCGREEPPGPRWFGCEVCRDAAGHPHWLEVRYDLESVPRDVFRRAGRVWDYAPLLPVREPDAAPTLGEGHTPLVRIDDLNRELGLPHLYLKLEAVNPTGAFKDRFHTVALAVARELGYPRAVVATAGNHGTACAAYAARAGISLLVITDPRSSPEQRRLMRLFGACITAPSRPGPVMPLAGALMETLVREHGFYPSTVLGPFNGPANPYGVEGYKTIAWETAAQLGRVPDRLCVPTSAGDALYGPTKGFRELRDLGLIDRLPRLTACQAAGANFVVETLRRGREAMVTVAPNTFALSIGDPTGGQYALAAIRETGGEAWEATDEEMLQAVALLGRHGVCAEGASAAPVAALRRQAAAGAIDPDEWIVAVLTGTGMKWPAQLDRALGPEPPLLPDDVETLLQAVGSGFNVKCKVSN
jgi:threonine synthase